MTTKEMTDMAENTPSKRVLAQLIPLMAKQGFTYLKKYNTFSRKVEQATHHFLVGFDGRGGLVSTDAFFFVTYDQIDAICGKAYDCKGDFRVAGGLSELSHTKASYDIFVEEYAGLTPREKGKVDPALVHPQERIDGAVRFLIHIYDTVAEPLFRQLRTHRDLADMWMHGKIPLFKYRIDRVRIVQLLSAGLGDDPGWANAEVEDLLAMCPLRTDLAADMEKLRHFMATSDPATLLFK